MQAQANIYLEKLKREKIKRGLVTLEDLEAQKQTAIRWQPQEGPQKAALESKADELLFGGSAGGGKTDELLGVAGTTQSRSIIFRRTFPSIRGIIERSREIYDTHLDPITTVTGTGTAKSNYNESLHIWRLANGKVVEFGSMQFEKDKENYRGRPHDFYGWDELTEFSESQYRFVNGWNRSTIPGQRCRIIATCNPPSTAEGQWVIRYWAAWLDPKHPNPARPGELRWYATIAGKDVECAEGNSPIIQDGETIYPRSRTFIPARLEDNSYLADSGYLTVLQALPEPLRSQMLYGDFSAGIEDDPWQVIPTEWVKLAMARWEASPQPVYALSALGVDVARGGRDQTIIAPRYGNWFGPLAKYLGSETPNGPVVAGLVLSHLQGVPDCEVNIDVIGVGGSVYDSLKGMDLRNILVTGVNVAERANGTDKSGRLRFINQKAEIMWKFREALDPVTGDNISLPPDSELLADLTAPKWLLRTNGIQVESKPDVKKRIGRSPDNGDAVLLAFWGSYSGSRNEINFVNRELLEQIVSFDGNGW